MDDQECRLVGDRRRVQGAEAVEGGDGETPVCCTAEVHWSGGRGKEGVCPEGGGGGECRDVCEGLIEWFPGAHDVQPVACGGCRVLGPCIGWEGSLSLGGACWQGVVGTADFGVGSGSLRVDWEEAIARVGEGCLVAYSDGSRDELGRVAGGRCGPRGAERCVLVGTVVTV